jgi:prevent-host-death family protein
MSQRRIAAGEFNHFPARARELARDHDVIVEQRGKPTTVLMSYERYRALTASVRSPLEAIADEAAARIDFEVPRLGELALPADLSS